MHSYLKSGLLFLVLSLTAMCCEPLMAQEAAMLTSHDQAATTSASNSGTQTTTSASPDKWSFVVAPYLWFPGLHGTVGAFGHNASVHASGTEVLSNFNFGLMGSVEAQKERFVFPVDFMWVRLSDNKGIPENDFGQTDIRVRLTQLLLTPKVGYRVVNKEEFKVDAVVGLRYWHLGQGLTIQPSGLGISPSDNWVDVVAGSKIEMALSPKTTITVLGDGGGGAANLDYQVAGLFGYKVKPKLTLLVGWRYLDVNYRGNNQFIYDAAQSGPVLAVTFELGGNK